MPTMNINGVPVAYEVSGTGEPLLLIHAGIVDMRMWDEVMPDLAHRFQTIRFDLRGYGDTPLPEDPFSWTADALALLDGLGVERAHLIGVSVGGGVALDLAIAHPERVNRLVLVGSGVPGWQFGEAMNQFDAAERAAVEGGDLEGASWLNVRFWLDGTRTPDEVDPALRQRVFEMQMRAFEVDNDVAALSWLVPDRGERLGDVQAPTLLLAGELDQPDIAAMGRAMEEAIPDARLVMLPGVAHLPPMEDPGGFLAVAVPFLEGQPLS